MEQPKSISRIRADYQQGLSHQQVDQRKEDGLVNAKVRSNQKTVPQIIRDNVMTLFNVFNFAIGVCIFLVGSYENLAYLFVIIGNILIGIIQEIRSKKMVEHLSLITMPTADVIRQGERQSIAVEELVLDDIMFLQAGKQICADAIVIHGQVEVNEALLTGESDPVVKRSGDTLLSGSFIISGTCYARVEHVGKENYATHIALSAQTYKKFKSELMTSLNKVVRFTSYFILPLGALMVLRSQLFLHDTWESTIISTSAALLGMLPKGLVLLTSVSLAAGVIKLARKRTLVQELFCIESLSRVDVLCLDKTGTLTQGNMQVTDVIALQPNPLDEPLDALLSTYVAHAEENNATFLALRNAFPTSQTNTTEVVSHTPFSSSRKWGSITLANGGTLYLGAPDRIAPFYPIPRPVSERIRQGARVLLFAYSAQSHPDGSPEEPVPLCAIVLHDPLRKDAKNILSFFAKEGVQVKIISGDHPSTVTSIAQQAGLQRWQHAVDATTLKTEADIQKAVMDTTIFGRVTPTQKRQIIRAFQAQGHTVAMVGDGVNDVLALKDADCSIAMAAGSEATRQIAQLVLLDSQFSSLPDVVMEGRRVVNNITRTASLFLIKTIFSFLLSFLTVLGLVEYPFIPIQLSLIGIVMEGIPAFLLTFEPNHARIDQPFLPTVLRSALPSALVVVVNILIIQLGAGVFGLTEQDVHTLDVLLTGFAALILLWKVCRPFNWFHRALWLCMTALFFSCAYLFHDLLSIGVLTTASWPVLIVMAVADVLLTWFLSSLARRVHLPASRSI